jgi:hypothetical protein
MQHLGLKSALIGSLALAIVSTLGDWLWANFLTDGAVLPGVIHGAVIFFLLAVILATSAGASKGRFFLLWALPVGGFALAAIFYPLARVIGYLAALLVTWMGMWLITATLQRLARGRVESLRRTAWRALAAAVGSGLAFWAIAGIWTQPSPEGPSYWRHFFSWAFAFFPGLLALLCLHSTTGPGSAPAGQPEIRR